MCLTLTTANLRGLWGRAVRLQHAMTKVVLNNTNRQQSTISCCLRIFIFIQRITFLPSREWLFTTAKHSFTDQGHHADQGLYSVQPLLLFGRRHKFLKCNYNKSLKCFLFQLFLSNAYQSKRAAFNDWKCQIPRFVQFSWTQMCKLFKELCIS